MKVKLGSDVKLSDVLIKLPTNPDDYEDNWFCYDAEYQELKLLDEKDLHPCFDRVRELYNEVAPYVGEQATCEISFTIYNKTNTRIRLDFDSIAQVEAMGCAIDIDIYNVSES